ncbi:hypothetical protein [Enterovibrio coralii]|uniref:hypothetical protein n=1 Tax=Enterovibrio coralii TaxID=294935 RepID=UPI001E618DB8|nr:hypothetical protein [Enterovibrio coralii]
MQTTRFHLHWPSKVASKPLLKPVLLAIAALFLLCLPLNQVPLSFEGIQHPSIALTFLLVIAIICFGLFEVARQKRFSTTHITKWLAIATLLAAVPSFYTHAQPSAAIWHLSAWCSLLRCSVRFSNLVLTTSSAKTCFGYPCFQAGLLPCRMPCPMCYRCWN